MESMCGQEKVNNIHEGANVCDYEIQKFIPSMIKLFKNEEIR